jgi:MFS family permease
MNKTKLWTKDFLTSTFTNFFLMLNYYLLVVVMTLYAMDTFGSSPSEAGFASSIFVIGALCARLYCGRRIEQVGRRKLLVVGTILSLVMTILYFGVTTIWFLFVIRFLHGAAYGIASTAIGTIVTHLIPDDRRGEGIGYYMLSLTLASAIGPFLGMFLTQHGGFRLIFVVCAIFGVLSFVSAFFLSVPEVKLTNEQLDEMKGFKWSNLFESKAIPISIVCSIIYFCYSSILSFLSPYAKEIHLVDAASFFFIVYSVAILISRPFTGRLFDSKGENITMYPAFLIFMIGMALLSQAHHGVTLLLAGAFLGFGLGVIQSCGLAIAVKATPRERLGLANSTFYIFLDGGVGIGPFVLGLFIPFTGYRGMYIGMAIVVAVCLLLYYLLHGRTAKLREHVIMKC